MSTASQPHLPGWPFNLTAWTASAFACDQYDIRARAGDPGGNANVVSSCFLGDACGIREAGKPSVATRPAREFDVPQIEGGRRTREQGGLSFLPSSGYAVDRGHEVARIGVRCARGCEVSPLSNCSGGAL